jgi:glyoxylase-like metal-dependent hydrolase (beta-lactamase superfamily II)
MRCLLVETDNAKVLVDTGLGNKESTRFHEIYGVKNQGQPTRLETSLGAIGVRPEEIDIVVCTHLHFDHAGGGTTREESGVRPAFPRARYVIRRGEYEFARIDNERIRASYMESNFEPLIQAGCVDLVDDDIEVTPGVGVMHTPGHTPYHQSVWVDLGPERLLFLADLVPTRAHLPLPWIMGYDIEPLVTLASKKAILGRALEEGWWLAFEHDPFVSWGRAAEPTEGRAGVRLVDEVEHPLVDEATTPER